MSHTDDRHVPEHVPDHESDPARTPGDGWVGEGGASHLGPATHTDSGRPAADEADDGETPVAE